MGRGGSSPAAVGESGWACGRLCGFDTVRVSLDRKEARSDDYTGSQMSDKDGEEESEEFYDGGFGGALRSTIRVVMRRVGRVVVGNVPADPRTLAKGADRFSELLEHTLTLRREIGSAPPMPEQKQKWYLPFLQAAPSLVKGSVLGAVLFQAYDFFDYRIDNKYLSGAGAGAVHGGLSVAWDRALVKLPWKWSTSPPALRSAPGTVVSHAAVHASLFGLFHLLVQKSDSDKGQVTPERVAFVSAAGIAAGFASELVAHYTTPLEQSLRHGFRLALSLPRPSFKALLLSSLPSGIGFLAFEFGV